MVSPAATELRDQCKEANAPCLMIKTLSHRRLQFATRWLAGRDIRLRGIFEQYGYPPLWQRPVGFGTMVHIILEQQVSLASANATYDRLRQELAGSVTFGGILAIEDVRLRELGFSKQKLRYVKLLAERTQAGFSFEALAGLADSQVRDQLMQHPGIGRWSADIYLSECLLRCDILPPGDIAMQEVYRQLHGLSERPSHEQFEAETQHWRPWRSVATRLLWHYYLSAKKR